MKDDSYSDDDVQFLPLEKKSSTRDSPTLSDTRPDTYESRVPLYTAKKDYPAGLPPLPLPPGLKITAGPAFERAPQPVVSASERRIRTLPLEEVVKLPTGRHVDIKTTFDIVFFQLEPYLLEESPKKRDAGPPHFMIAVERSGEEAGMFATATVCTWERHGFNQLTFLDRATITGIDIKPNQIVKTAKDITFKRGQLLERVTRPTNSHPWPIDDLYTVFVKFQPKSRRMGRFPYIKATIYNVAKQPPGVSYTEYALQSDPIGRTATGRFYDLFRDTTYADGTVITLMHAEVTIEGDDDAETVVISVDPHFDRPQCYILGNKE